MAQNASESQNNNSATNEFKQSQNKILKSKATFQTMSNSVNVQMQNKLQLDWFENANEYGIVADDVLIGIEPTATALSMAIVRLHCIDNDHRKFKDANLSGIFCFMVDRQSKTRFFRLYDINTSELLFQCELYIGFKENYKMLRDKFYFFQLHKTVIGVEYSNLHDALYFKKLVDKFAFSGEPQVVAKEQKKIMGLNDQKLSLPGNFQKVNQPGWNPITQTFNLKEMPSQLKTMLKKGGFKKKHLKNKESAVLIYELLLKDVGFAEQEAEPQQANDKSENPTMIFENQDQGGSFFARGSMGQAIASGINNKLSLMKQATKRSDFVKDQQGESLNNSMLNRSSTAHSRPQPPVAPRGPPVPPARGGARPPPRPRAPGAPAARGPPRPAPIRPMGGAQPQAAPTLSLAEQLRAQAGKLKKNDVSVAPKTGGSNNAKYGMTKHQEMKLTTNMATLHAQIAARRKALGNDDSGKGSDESDEEDDDDDDLDDDSD